MTPQEIKKITDAFVEEINANGKFRKRYDLFLKIFKMNQRRNLEVLASAGTRLKKQGITVWCGSEKRRGLTDFERDEYITLRNGTGTSGANAKNGEEKIAHDNAGSIQIARAGSGLKLYKHQEDAVQALNKKILQSSKSKFAGLLVLPTGGGKTLTAAYWLSKNFLDKGKKVLWIAHRHELLVQAKETFHKCLAYSDIFSSKTTLNYRVLSGIHDKPVNIKPTDDIIISSKDSLLNGGFDHLRQKWLDKHAGDVFLVIDEAHHATAKTYRAVVDQVAKKVPKLKTLGLTATPFRTAENEQGLLAKVFPDDIVYKVDLRTLISRGILAEPIFEEVQTKVDFERAFSQKQLEKIRQFDLNALGDEAIETIASNKDRNLAIVSHYVKNKAHYGRTLLFAVNQTNAVALNALFKQKGVKSDYVISGVKNQITGTTISPKENAGKIERFRKGELDVLINVNILTEGTDVPKIQTVFLARPTISTILMTQMIGRGLRGEKAGGTKNAYIVSFVDDWKDKVAWVNPEKLIIEENVDFADKAAETRKNIARLIAINKIEEFAILMNEIVDKDAKKALENLEFIERVPVGIYHFSFLMPGEGTDSSERNREILVYDNLRRAYADLMEALPGIFERRALQKIESLKPRDLEEIVNEIDEAFFEGTEKYPGYRREDIEDLVRYYAQNASTPKFIELKDREKYDLTSVAREIVRRDLGPNAQKEYKRLMWETSESEWKAFFGHDNFRVFITEVDLAVRRLTHPEEYERPSIVPTDQKELRALAEMSMGDLREKRPEYWRWLSDQVYERHRDKKTGEFVSASKKVRSKNKLDFQIDHIISMSRGGKTVLENLQLLTRRENGVKGRN